MATASVGCQLAPPIPRLDYCSDDSLLDFDVILFDPEGIHGDIEGGLARGQVSAVPNDLFDQHAGRRRTEMVEVASRGGTVFVFASRISEWRFGPVAARSVFGQPVVDLGWVVGIPGAQTLPCKSRRLEYCGPSDGPLRDFWNAIEAEACCTATWTHVSAQPVVVVSGTQRLVAGVIREGAGRVILIPRVGRVDEPEFAAALCKLARGLIDADEESEPAWIDELETEKGINSLAALSRAEKNALEAEAIVRAAKADHDQARTAMGLLYLGGTALEERVIAALVELGVDAKRGPRGSHDVFFQWGDVPVVLEVKGKKRSATDRNARQLMAWLLDFEQATGRRPKGVLLVNGWRNLHPHRRSEPVFPRNVVERCKRIGATCLTTTQLLGLLVECTGDQSLAKSRIDELVASHGLCQRYADPSLFLFTK